MTDDAPALIPQPHGGALRPFTSGTGAAARRSSVRAARKQSLALLAEATPAAARRLVELVSSEDERVAAIACSQILDRTLGRPGEVPQFGDSDDVAGAPDMSVLTPAERLELADAVLTVRRLVALARERAGAG